MRGVEKGEVVIACQDLDETLRFFTDELGFGLELITPADDPAEAVVVGHGLRLRLDASPVVGRPPSAGRLRLVCQPSMIEAVGRRLAAPNGTAIELVAAGLDVPAAAPTFELSRFDAASFGTGRASMSYRDLLPDRQGGRYIASHIRIAEAGPVPDYVHHHRIRFQMIYCYRGWVRVVYEDQGPPFVMRAGDCVLQPPRIRHRVLESSGGLEVVEIGSPARHDTLADPTMELPTGRLEPGRDFDGQCFVRHEADRAEWIEGAGGALAVCDLGIGAATDGLAEVRVLASTGRGPTRLRAPADAELYFLFVTAGRAELVGTGLPPTDGSTALGPADSVALPAGGDQEVVNLSADFEALELTVAHP